MKTKIILSISLAFCLMHDIAFGQESDSSDTDPNCYCRCNYAEKKFKREYPVNLCGNWVTDSDKAICEIQKFHKDFRLASATCELSKYSDTINKKDWDYFIKILSEKTEKLDSNNHVTGVRIIFSSENKKIKLFYAPVIMIRKKLTNSFKIVSDTTYMFDKNSFKPVDGVRKQTRHYRKYKRFTHSYNDRNKKPHNIPTKKGDVRSMIFTFQELYSVMEYCNSESLTFIHALSPYQGRLPSKHHLYIGANKDHVTNASLTNSTKDLLDGQYLILLGEIQPAANRSHLCPTDCNSTKID